MIRSPPRAGGGTRAQRTHDSRCASIDSSMVMEVSSLVWPGPRSGRAFSFSISPRMLSTPSPMTLAGTRFATANTAARRHEAPPA